MSRNDNLPDTDTDTDRAERLYNALATAGDAGLPLASIARLVGAQTAGKLLAAMGRDIIRINGRYTLTDG